MNRRDFLKLTAAAVPVGLICPVSFSLGADKNPVRFELVESIATAAPIDPADYDESCQAQHKAMYDFLNCEGAREYYYSLWEFCKAGNYLKIAGQTECVVYVEPFSGDYCLCSFIEADREFGGVCSVIKQNAARTSLCVLPLTKLNGHHNNDWCRQNLATDSTVHALAGTKRSAWRGDAEINKDLDAMYRVLIEPRVEEWRAHSEMKKAEKALQLGVS